MLRVLSALPLCVLFLCAAGDAPRGVCVDTKCYAFFFESADSAEAKTRCQNSGGTLYDVGQWGNIALTLPLGHFWIKAPHTAGPASERCRSAVVTSEIVRFEDRACTDRLDGIVCQYTSTCRALPHSKAEHVNYTTAWGFEGQTLFPPGTVAVVHVPDHPPISKHLCAGPQWMRAPWACEVMNGGCERGCTKPHVCSCPAGLILHHNKYTCTEDPCATCTHLCVEVGGKQECRCREGFKLGPRGDCVDIDECSVDRTLCSGYGEACKNNEGSYECTCQDDYELVDEVCVDTTLCFDCEHECEEVQGQLSPKQCYCPQGYIQDERDTGTVCTDIDECEEEAQCEYHCVNTFGGFFCECEEGFQAHSYLPVFTPTHAMVYGCKRTHYSFCITADGLNTKHMNVNLCCYCLLEVLSVSCLFIKVPLCFVYRNPSFIQHLWIVLNKTE
uniref:EGF-like domain-containing protein n=1 Tax=Neogobius melanostomus TaxID=47308 RepID=A0A8C6V2U9_9GOBI